MILQVLPTFKIMIGMVQIAKTAFNSNSFKLEIREVSIPCQFVARNVIVV